MIKTRQCAVCLLGMAALFISCGKDFLNMKPNVKQRVPTSVDDYLGLLNNTETMNQSSCHALGVLGADEFFLSAESFATFPIGSSYNYQKNAYIWNTEVDEGAGVSTDWGNAYQRILWCNLVLEGIDAMPVMAEEKTKLNSAKGMALFYRAWNYDGLAQLYCPQYGTAMYSEPQGLPLRLESDLTLKIPRSTVDKTYLQIIADLDAAENLLASETENPFQPGKAALHALLSRVYLQMKQYDRAYQYAGNCLKLTHELIDFNEVDLGPVYRFPANGTGNPEVIFNSALSNIDMLKPAYFNIGQQQLALYGPDDLRKSIFFSTNSRGQWLFSGSYYGSSTKFTGLATDEVYLVHAECAARMGNTQQALDDLNELRMHRINKESFIPLVSDNASEVLDWIIQERRRELVLRGTRWEDLRRLNQEPRYAYTVTRVIGEQTVVLEPNDRRYTWPLPHDAIQVGGYAQNDR